MPSGLSRRALLATPLAGASLAALPAAAAEPPLVLAGMGSFHLGGREATVSGRPAREVPAQPGQPPLRIDPNGTYQVEGMYVQYHIPEPRRGRFPLLLWHGGATTGVVWESTPDGREGFQQWFLRRGWPVYVSDAVERGRAGWAMFPEITAGEPVFLTKDNPWERFRIGPGRGSYHGRLQHAGGQFPAEAYDAFTRQLVPRWTTTNAATLAAYRQLLQRVGPAVVMAHSQGAGFADRAARAEPGLVKALVLIEPAGLGEAAGAPLAALRDVPVLLLYGDFIDGDARWSAIRRQGLDLAAKLRGLGGTVDVVSLPERGLRGNSHLLMMERNNAAVARLIQDWLAARGLWE
ncbi:esterase [Roseomonas sp. OT10]|uniref:esterase n=1 Tax=Roseomonas cutis TaxID=2897332 RepID=UPI001E302A5C|nr:esterase [Roseomonas sp. OT10]UFN48764.1 esterase [Roseomonas sp. OT10]